ncbi:MAG: S16 family serine protease [Lapillicoccus sp.]
MTINSEAVGSPPGRRRGTRVLRRLVTTGALVLLVAAAAAADVSGTRDFPRVRVEALWYGKAADGSIQAGVTPVTVAASYDDPSTPLLVDTGGLRAAGAGPMWTAATAVAEIQAVLIAGVDPREVQVTYSLKEAIDGPSAGALLSAASLASVRGVPLLSKTTMTGTVLPDGSVGPVSGISDKLKAAQAAGFTRVLVPIGPSTDVRTGRPVDLVALGQSIGVEVIPVSDVPQAFGYLTGTPDVAKAQQPSPIAPGVISMLERRSRALVATGTAQLEALTATTDPDVQAALPGIGGWLRVAQDELVRGDAVRAFAAAAEAGQALQEFTALDRVHRGSAQMSLTEQVAQLRQEAAGSKTEIRAAVLATAATPVTTVEQLAALPDVLAWGLFAMTSMDVVDVQLNAVQSRADLDEAIRFIETARFEADTYMPATADALPFIGRQSLSDPARAGDLLDAYATLMADGAEANSAYADSLPSPRKRSGYLRSLIEDTRKIAAGTDAGMVPDLGPTARPALRLGAALLEYVETTQLVNDLTSRPLPGTSSPPNTQPIKDPAVVARQATTAATITASQTAAVGAAGLDASYLQWNSQWGQELAFGRLPEITDEQTLHGLEYQWFAVLHSRVLLALGK